MMTSLLIEQDRKQELQARLLNLAVAHHHQEVLIRLLMIVAHLIVILAHPHLHLGLEEEEAPLKEGRVRQSGDLALKVTITGQDHQEGDQQNVTKHLNLQRYT